jgi:hypothetical protein
MFAMLLPDMRKKNAPAEAEGGAPVEANVEAGADGTVGVDSSAGVEVETQDDAGLDLDEQALQIDRETQVVEELGAILWNGWALVITQLQQLLPSKKPNPSSAA